MKSAFWTVLIGATLSGASCAGADEVNLSSLDIKRADQGWGQAGRDKSVSDKPLSISGRSFVSGFGTHAPSELHIKVNGATSFEAQVGVDDGADATGSVVFSLIGDGRTLWTSRLLKSGDAPQMLNVGLYNTQYLTLKVTDGGDDMSNDHADWGAAKFRVTGENPVAVDRLPAQAGQILSGKAWLDTEGNLIQAHGGGILKRGDTYYWYGEDKSTGYNNKVGVDGYASEDLVNWRPMGTVFKASDMPEQFREGGVAERPKVIYNAKTGKYVMWIHMDANGYKVSEAGVGVADKPEGPFVWLKSFRPIDDSTYRDMNLFVDDDGTAYTFYSGEGNATTHIIRLNDDYTDIERPLKEGENWARVFPKKWREAAAPFKYNGKYYMITSGTSGWNPNAASYGMADNILGPWTDHGNPIVGEGADTTHRSQSTFVFPSPSGKKGEFIYMGDRWNSKDLANSRYIWLPFTIKDDGTFNIEWQADWKPEIKAK